MTPMRSLLKAPFPWFGGKTLIARLVWQRLGNPANYIEPFFGGGAVLLARPDFDPDDPPLETANDINAWLANLWRAIQADPDGVAAAADWPVNEIDLHARGDGLFYKGVILSEKNGKRLMKPDEFVERLRGDPEWYDSKIAGWWVWGQSSWIGDNWGHVECRSRPHLSGAGQGVNRKLPHLSDAGRGVHRKRPHLGSCFSKGIGVNSYTRPLLEYMRHLSARLRRVRVCCGDWLRVMSPCVTTGHGMTAIFLDPPYAVADRDSVYGEDDSHTLAHDVRAWCIENGNNPLLRIALCGYEEHSDLAAHGWTPYFWKTGGGYASQNRRGNDNAEREVIWFSPACLSGEPDMFGSLPAAPGGEQP